MDTVFLWILLNHGISNQIIDLHIPKKEFKVNFYDIKYQTKYLDKVSGQFRRSESNFRPEISNWSQFKIKVQFAFQTKWMVVYLNLTFPPILNEGIKLPKL